MFNHDLNVYDILASIDSLLENGQEDSASMDRAESVLLTNKLVDGAVELLRHLAIHNVLRFETAESYELISYTDIVSASMDDDDAFAQETVVIELPPNVVPYGSVQETLKTWNLGKVETVADLTVLASLWQRYLAAESNSPEESAIYSEWVRQAFRIREAVLPAVQLLDSAGLLRVADVRTEKSYSPFLTTLGVEVPDLEISIASDADPVRSSRKKRS